MSVTKSTTIWCDYNIDCAFWYGDDGRLVDRLRKDARKEGWRYKDGKDLYPKHSKS